MYSKKSRPIYIVMIGFLIVAMPHVAFSQCTLSEGFDDITTLAGAGWDGTNNSDPLGVTNWFQGNPAVFASQGGADDSYIAANFNNTGTSGPNTISNWLFTPVVTLQNGSMLSFWTRTVTGNFFPDRLQVRMSTNGASTDVGSTATSIGDFTALLLDINPTYAQGGYPDAWTQYTVTITGVPSPVSGRLALRYFVEDGGPIGANSNYIGIDTLCYTVSQSIADKVSGWVFGDNLAKLVEQLGLAWWPGKAGDPPQDVGVEVNVGDPFRMYQAPVAAIKLGQAQVAANKIENPLTLDREGYQEWLRSH